MIGKRTLAALLFMMLTAHSAKALTSSDKLLLLIAAIEENKTCPALPFLKALGSNADSIIVRMINEKSIPAWKRVTAVSCLRHYSSKKSKQILSSMISDPSWDDAFRHQAMDTIVDLIGEEAFYMLKKYAVGPNKTERLAAIKAMAKIRTERTGSFFRYLQTRESDPEILSIINQGLR